MMERSGYFTIGRAFFEEWAVWLTASEWKVLCALLCDANEYGLSWHSALNIAKRLNMSRDTVERALRKLDKDGYIKREVRDIKGPIKRYQYRIAKKYQISGPRQRQRKRTADSRKNLLLDSRKTLPLTAGKTSTARQDIPAQSNTSKKERKNPAVRGQSVDCDFPAPTVVLDFAGIFDDAPRSDQLPGDANTAFIEGEVMTAETFPEAVWQTGCCTDYWSGWHLSAAWLSWKMEGWCCHD